MKNCASGLSSISLGLLALLLANTAFSQPYGLENRPPIGPFLNGQIPPGTPGPTGDWTTVVAFPNLTFEDPVCLVPEPGTNRLYVCCRQGTIYFFDNQPASATKTLFLDLRTVTQGWDDCGIMSMAFHPQYGQPGSPNRGYFYICYQYSPTPSAGPGRPPNTTPGYNRLSRFTVPDGSSVADPGSEQILVNQFDESVWHNGGAMLFGPDGFLYFSNGDEGLSNDSYNNTQKLTNGLFSGVFRIDVDQDPTKSHPIIRQPMTGGTPPGGWPATFTANYYIPNDNPFANPDGSVLEEFWALGLRSPHRMTYDAVADRIWMGDVGQGTREEIDIIERGGNYQWAFREGTVAGPKAKPNPVIGIEKAPLYDYGRANGDTCIIGGYVYRGTEFAAELGGKYIFGDNTSQRLWTLAWDGVNPPVVAYLANMPPGANYTGMSSFGVDNNNELYICKMGSAGQIYKIGRTTPNNPLPPALLSQTGAFADLATLAPATGVIPFNVNSPLWSDGSVKSRWIAVPNDGAPYDTNETIGFAASGEWTFPSGTVFVKHFELPTDDNDPNIRKRLETRLLVRETNGAVYGFTYKWREDNTDADLLTASLSEDILIATTSGTRTQTWYYPSPQDCLNCHNPNANHVLGVKTRQLNGDFLYAETGVTDNQLRTLNHLGIFNPALNEAAIPTYAKTVAVTDTNATLDTRMRSYIDANCAHCHRPNGVQAYFDARFDIALANQGIVNGVVGNSFGITGARVVAPASILQSIMHLRMNTNGTAQMPPLARNKIDASAIAALEEWINSLPPTPNAPSGLNAVAVSPNQIDISWTDNSANELGFKIERSTNGVNFVQINTVGANVLTFPNTGLTASTVYYYRVRAYHAYGDSDYSNAASATTLFDGSLGTGLKAEYYDNTNFTSLKTTRVDPTVNFTWGAGIPSGTALTSGDTFSVRWSGSVQPQYSQTYTFYTSSDDGVRLWVNGKLLINKWVNQSATEWSGTIALTANQKYNVQMDYFENGGDASAKLSWSSTSQPKQIIPQTKLFPVAAWTAGDIGSVGVAGSATVNDSTGVFTVKGAGANIWNASDAFQFIDQPLTGNGQIVARVTQVQNTGSNAKAGVMVRETLAANARNAFMALPATGASRAQRRTSTGGTTSNTAGSTVSKPYWVRLVRSGNTITYSISSNGASWTQVTSQSITMASQVYFGLAVTSGTTSQLNTSIFDNVRVTALP